jgi:outer membrane protein
MKKGGQEMAKKYIIPLFVAAGFLLIFAEIGFAQDMQGRFGVGAWAAYVIYEGDEYDYSIYDVDADFDEAAMYGGTLTYFLHRYFSLELSAGYVDTDVDLKIQAPGDITRSVVGVGNLEQFPVLLTARTHFSTNPKVNPYFGVGVGYYFNDFDSSDFVLGEMPSGGRLDPEDSIGFHINTGVEIFLDENFAFNLEMKYLWHDTDVQAKAPEYTTEEFSLDLDAFCVGIGFKYYL